jgi:hypothetical protein
MVVGYWQNKVGLTRYPYVFNEIFATCEWQDASSNPMWFCENLNLDNKPRKLIVIVCIGVKSNEEFLALVLVVWIKGHIVMWFNDPMHGSTINVASSLKTQRFDAILVSSIILTPFSIPWCVDETCLVYLGYPWTNIKTWCPQNPFLSTTLHFPLFAKSLSPSV